MKKWTAYSNYRSRDRDNGAGPAAGDRRGALKGLVAGGAAVGVLAVLPSRWTRPVVESVMLPAHAQTSAGEMPDGDFFPVDDDDTFEITGLGDGKAPGAFKPGWLEWLVPGAHAGGNIPALQCNHCGACARIRNGKVTATIVRFDVPNDTQVCYEAAGVFGETASFSVVGTPSNICSPPNAVDIVRLEGQAPNRVLVVSDGATETNLAEDPSRTCDCDAFLCPPI